MPPHPGIAVSDMSFFDDILATFHTADGYALRGTYGDDRQPID
jgi:hypothetical protein